MLLQLLSALVILHASTATPPKQEEQDKEEFLAEATYTRTDMLTKHEETRRWVFTVKPRVEEITISKQVAPSKSETEKVTIWGRETPLNEVIVEERVAFPVDEERETNFGYVEVRDPGTNEVLSQWPMFCKTTEGTFLYRTYCWALMKNGSKYETLRHFRPGEVMRPFIERKRILTFDGKVPFDVEDKLK